MNLFYKDKVVKLNKNKILMLHRPIQIQNNNERQISLLASPCLNISNFLQESLQQINEVGFGEGKSYWYKRPCLKENYFS